ISTGIEEKVNTSTMSFSYTDNATICISGSAAGEAVLYDVNGKLLQRQKVSGGNATINVASYAPGVYILNLTNEHSFKIIKK
ncbi:T9SS type A sorting domain-containing protein, partial [Prevotella sp.]